MYRMSLASGTETSQVFAALPIRGTHAQGSPIALTSLLAPTLRTFRHLPFFSFLRQSTTFTAYGRHARVEFPLTFRAERQARTGLVFHSPLVPNGRRARSSLHSPLVPNGGRARSSLHSPLVPNGWQARVEFSLTPRAERQARLVEFSLTPRAERQARLVVFSLTSRAER
ncbi:unnamed protein product [Prunus armeniaca]